MTFQEIFEYIKQGGVPGILLIWLWLERQERISAQAELKQVSEKSVTAISEMKALVGQLAVIFKPNGPGP
jgi:hypothetical protein